MGKIHHKQEHYDEAEKYYSLALKINKGNFAASFNLSKIHYLNGNYTAVVDNLTVILKNHKYKDSFEAIRLLAKVKGLQGKIYEGLALYKRVLELNPRDHQISFEIGQMFDQID